jgi:hypothetical protein
LCEQLSHRAQIIHRTGEPHAPQFKNNFFCSGCILRNFRGCSADDGPPRIDFKKLCRSRVEAVGEVGGATVQDLVNSCVTAEREAQTALVAAWKNIPPSYKARCIKPNDYSPSYGEWIACLELLIDVKSLRKH